MSDGITGSVTEIKLCPSATPGYIHSDRLTRESATLASKLLTDNHASFHTRWKATFHNHLVHHVLALWSLGASPYEIQDMWDLNAYYQNKIEPAREGPAKTVDLKDPAVFDSCLGQDEYYADFLQFFESEIAQKGVPTVVREYLLNGEDRANDILGRMFTDLVHPIIHLGCGIEYHQPSLIAEALAGACVHENYPKLFILPPERYAASNKNVSSKSLLNVMNDLREDSEIASGVKDSDPFNKIPDGFLKRVTADQLAPFLAQFQVKPTTKDLQDKMADMMYTCAYIMGAAQRPGKREAIDFVTLHCVTLSVFYPAIMAQEWLTNEEKARLLEATARVNAVLYAGAGCPALYASRIVDYAPRHPCDGWPELFHRAIVYRDEGHVAKLVRAIFALQQLDGPEAGFPIAKQDFIKIAHMAVDSVEGAFGADGHTVPREQAEAVVKRVGPGSEMVVGNMTRWVFYGGLDNAWNHVPNSITA